MSAVAGWPRATAFPRMLAAGLILQILGLVMLSGLDPAWSAAASVAWVVAAQGIAGVAKDLTKTASKSAIKATSDQGSGQLFRWVAWFTGSKNATKGIRLFRRRLPAATGRLPSGAVADGGRARPGAARRRDVAAPPARQGEGVEELSRAVRQDARDQPDGGCPHLPVRLPRRLVRRRTAGVPLRLRLEVHAGRRLRRGLDDRLRCRPGAGALDGDAQPRRADPRGSGRPRVGRSPDRHTGWPGGPVVRAGHRCVPTSCWSSACWCSVLYSP